MQGVKEGDTVIISYIGRLEDGTVFGFYPKTGILSNSLWARGNLFRV